MNHVDHALHTQLHHIVDQLNAAVMQDIIGQRKMPNGLLVLVSVN
jgi:hypothetical protein